MMTNFDHSHDLCLSLCDKKPSPPKKKLKLCNLKICWWLNSVPVHGHVLPIFVSVLLSVSVSMSNFQRVPSQAKKATIWYNIPLDNFFLYNIQDGDWKIFLKDSSRTFWKRPFERYNVLPLLKIVRHLWKAIFGSLQRVSEEMLQYYCSLPWGLLYQE